MRLDPHRRSEALTVAYHRVIADRLQAEPDLLAAARATVERWLAAGPASYYAKESRCVLEGDVDSIAAFLVDPGEKPCELRQSSPFAGALAPRERWRIWRATQDSLRASK